MILKRFTESLRRQDWTSVAIEFLLVLIGVLLAFQINEWATQRADKRAHNEATQRLLLEAEGTVAFFRLGVKTQAQLEDDLSYALTNLQSGRWPQADRERMTQALWRASGMTTPWPPSSVYDDLVSSGVFGRIGDPQMRTAVARYYSTLGFHRESVEYLRRSLPDVRGVDGLNFMFDPAAPGQMRLVVDFTKLEKDAAALEDLAFVASAQSIAMVLRKRNLKRAIEMCKQIGRVASRPCQLDQPTPSFD
jgi:hypothetical protein